MGDVSMFFPVPHLTVKSSFNHWITHLILLLNLCRLLNRLVFWASSPEGFPFASSWLVLLPVPSGEFTMPSRSWLDCKYLILYADSSLYWQTASEGLTIGNLLFPSPTTGGVAPVPAAEEVKAIAWFFLLRWWRCIRGRWMRSYYLNVLLF
jgi:hypothetical protein